MEKKIEEILARLKNLDKVGEIVHEINSKFDKIENWMADMYDEITKLEVRINI